MAGGQPLRLGPFTSGLNTASDPTAIADAELVELTNFELDIDGSLISRTPAQELQGHIGWSERILCIGEGVFNGLHYMIGSNISGVYYYLNSTWTLITNTFQASVAVQYADKVYLVAKPGSGNGGKWDPSGGFVAVAAIPKGQAAVVHKERLFICPGIDAVNNTSRLTFSDPGNLDSWPGTNFIDIGQGDGTKLIDLTIFQDNMLLFKEHSTYVLSYDIRPTDATMRQVSTTIGVIKQKCVVNYENQVYIIDHTGWVYEIINFDFNRLNTKVPFIRDETIPSPFSSENIFISTLEDRLICRYYRKVYVYGLRTRTWSEWVSNSESLQFFGPVITLRPSTGNEYYSGSCISAKRSVIKFVNTHTSTDIEKAYNTVVTATDNFNEVVVDGWGTSDQGTAWVNSGGAASDYDKTGTEGTHTLTSVAVTRNSSLALGIKDVYERIFFKTSALAAGNGILVSLTARDNLGTTFYYAQVSLNATQTINLLLVKIVAGVTTVLTNVVTGLTHVANTKYGLRFRVHDDQLQARIWLATNPEPISWDTTATDTSIVASGAVKVQSVLNTGNTNTLPVTVTFDDFEATNLAVTEYVIDCSTRTKNFDMAVSHQFKRLWWWGVDVSTPNDIIGTATPVILSFGVTWDQLGAYTWDQLAANTWDQPLSVPLTVVTTIVGAGGLSRRFAKFEKSLRYRQINFRVQLKTDGSTSDGPARIFTMTVVTETKAIVPKAVN